ncbi:MAG TPA: response regulator, partial [Thiobacillaceae bacterium]|nr:response regulator [Thiobacillaceae bacterium]HNH89992.1 response regulator [Thiobacillaceae bacterium]
MTETEAATHSEEITGRVLVVDDDRTIRHLHQSLLAKRFEVAVAVSGEEALAACAERLPDLVLLDVEMPGMDGYETCRRLRQSSDVPIIFVTNHQSLDEHVKAFDAGGNDIVTKPAAGEILVRKATLAIQQHRATAQLAEEKENLNRMAMGFLSSMGQSGILLNFMRASVACRSHRALAEGLIAALADLGVAGSVLIRHADGPTALTSHGEPTPLECAILQKASGMGRIFQFSTRLVANYDRVSILIANMPDEKLEAERAGQIRDNIATLAETVEALCDTV